MSETSEKADIVENYLIKQGVYYYRFKSQFVIDNKYYYYVYSQKWKVGKQWYNSNGIEDFMERFYEEN